MTGTVLPERVEGSRLTLRRWTPEDVDLLHAAVARNVEHLRPWMPWVADEPLSRGARLALLDRWEGEWLSGGDVLMAILSEGQVVGGSGLHRRTGPHGLEIGYWVDFAHLGERIASEAASMLTAAALSLDDISFVEIHHDKANLRSRRVPERLGFELVAETADEVTASGEIGIDCAWRMTAEAWIKRDAST